MVSELIGAMIDRYYDAWRSRLNVIDRDEINVLRRYLYPTGFYLQCECPCGGSDHVATIPMIPAGYAESEGDFLTCFETERQWFIRRRPVADIIRDEEVKYLNLLAKSESVCRKAFKRLGVTDAAYHFLKDTHGIDKEIAEFYAGLSDGI